MSGSEKGNCPEPRMARGRHREFELGLLIDCRERNEVIVDLFSRAENYLINRTLDHGILECYVNNGPSKAMLKYPDKAPYFYILARLIDGVIPMSSSQADKDLVQYLIDNEKRDFGIL